MPRETEKVESYREQVARLARALAAARSAEAAADLAPGSPASRVKMFVDGNLDKRFEKLQRQVEFVAPAFEDLDALLEKYVRAYPAAAYDTGVSDGERFLVWLEHDGHPTAEQRDYIACQRARHAVEDEARANRLGHVRFQELRSAAEALAEELGTNRALRVYLNPIRVWSRFQTRTLLDEEASLPADVLFFPLGSEIRTAVLEGNSRERVRELAALGPVTLDEWLAQLEPFVGPDDVGPDTLAALCRDLAGLGIVAFG